MTELSDNELIQQAKEGDQYAFSLLFDRYQAKVFNFVARSFGFEIAEEATQNTFIAVYKNLHRYRPGKSAQPWIFHIAKNAARTSYRQRKRSAHEVSIDEPGREETPPLSESIKSKELDPRESLRAKEYQAAIQKAIESLPEIYREVLVLHDIEGIGYDELEKILRIPYNRIGQRLWMARKLFRKAVPPGAFELYLYFRERWTMITNRLMIQVERIRLSGGTAAMLVDGELGTDRAARVREALEERPELLESLRMMEEVKVLLKSAARFDSPPHLKTNVMAEIGSQPIAEPPLVGALLGSFDLLLEKMFTLPRALVTMGLAASFSLGTLGYVAHVENARAFKVVAVRGEPSQIVAGIKAPIAEGIRLKAGEQIQTSSAEEVRLRRKDLFSLEVKEKTSMTIERLDHVGGIGVNEFALHEGELFFESESKLRVGNFRVETPWFQITHAGTVASLHLSPQELIVTVLSGKMKLEPLGEVANRIRAPIIVSEGEEFIFNREDFKIIQRPVGEAALTPLRQFGRTTEVVLLGLEPQRKASSLVGKKQRLAFSLFDFEDPEDRRKIEEVKRSFETPGGEIVSLRNATQLIREVAIASEKKGRVEVWAKLSLIEAAIHDNAGDYDQALARLAEPSQNNKLDPELRALALCAMGIIYEERLNDPIRARERYEAVLQLKLETTIADEARERLNK